LAHDSGGLAVRTKPRPARRRQPLATSLSTAVRSIGRTATRTAQQHVYGPPAPRRPQRPVRQPKAFQIGAKPFAPAQRRAERRVVRATQQGPGGKAHPLPRAKVYSVPDVLRSPKGATPNRYVTTDPRAAQRFQRQQVSGLLARVGHPHGPLDDVAHAVGSGLSSAGGYLWHLATTQSPTQHQQRQILGQGVNKIGDAQLRRQEGLTGNQTVRALTHPSEITHALHGLVEKGVRHQELAGAGQLGDVRTQARIASTPYQVGRALVEHPSAIPKTLKGLGELALAAPAGVVQAAADPVQAVGAAKQDFSRRYGPLAKGNAKAFRARIGKEGASAEIADISLIGGAEGALLGRGAGRAARTGALGARAQRLATEARPALRISGNLTREQQLSPNLIRAGLQRGQDVARRRVQARRVARAPDEGVRGIQPQGPNEVAPLTLSSQHRLQRVAASEVQSRAFQAFRNEQGHEIGLGARRNIARLNPDQRDAVFHVMQGIVSPDNPRLARRQLLARKASIVAEYRRQGLQGVPREVKVIDRLVANADKVFGPKLRAFHAEELARGHRVGHMGVTDTVAEARRYRPQAHVLGVPYDYQVARDTIKQRFDQELRRAPDANAAEIVKQQRDEALANLEDQRPALDRRFVQRVRTAANEAGLPEPAYLQHFKHPTEADRRAAFAVGGSRATAGVKQSELRLFASGRADTRPQAYLQSLARSIKRKHNWPLVAKQAEVHAFPNPGVDEIRAALGHHANPDRLTADDWRTILEHRGWNAQDYSFWNPGRFRSELEHRSNVAERPHEAAGDLKDQTDLEHALTQGIIPADSATFPRNRGLKLIPRQVDEEINAAARGGQTLPGRIADKFQAVQSRLLLGTSPGWMQIQVGANAFLAGFGTHGNVADFLRAPLWYRNLSPELKQAADEMFGSGVGEAHGHKVHLGAATNNSLINWYRTLRETAAFKAGHVKSRIPGVRHVPGNPIDAIFAFDHAQNAYFKRVVLYNRIKRAAYQDMTRKGGAAYRLEGQITNLLSLGPKEQMRAITENPKLFEDHARAVNDILGDYVRYTARERKTFKRFVLFYGFMRYALKTLFYTMPVKHPLVLAAVAKLAQLHNQEVKDLLGGNDAPWAFSRIFFRSGSPGSILGLGDKVPGSAGLYSTDLARLNPVSTPFTDVSTEGVKSFGSFMSPLVQNLADQLYGKRLYTGQPLRVHGSAEQQKSIDAGTRGRILLNDALSQILPYRALSQATQRGTQGDDALLFSPRPIKYKTAAAQAKEKQRQASRAGGLQALLQQLEPFLPRPDTTRQTVANIRKKKGKGKGVPVPAGGPNYGNFSAPSTTGGPDWGNWSP
jgi:hypothetical protein